MSRRSTLGGLLESFFRSRLVEQRNASPATVANYRDALRLLILYAAERTHHPPSGLEVTDLDRELVLDFLDHLERVRGNGIRTRNSRLTAIRSFFHHVAMNDPALLRIAQRVLEIPNKRPELKAPQHLAEPELDALLNAPDRQTTRGRRDHALLLFLARTGARISEALAVDAADLHLRPPTQVLLHGKGRKQRRVPLAADLVRTLRGLCREQRLAPDDRCPLFVGASGDRLTRFGATHIVRRAVKEGSAEEPALARKGISPHVLRHTLAMNLLRSGVDLVTIQAWLGHAHVATTHRYAEADVEMMRRSLKNTDVSMKAAPRFQPTDPVLQLLEGL